MKYIHCSVVPLVHFPCFTPVQQNSHFQCFIQPQVRFCYRILLNLTNALLSFGSLSFRVSKSVMIRESVAWNACRSFTCSMMFRSINTCSVVSLPFLYPACFFLNLSSTPLLILSIIILHSIFPTTESKGMPLQFLQCLVFPFFASLMISPRLQLFGLFWYCHIFFISWYIISDENSICVLSVTLRYGVNSWCFPIL